MELSYIFNKIDLSTTVTDLGLKLNWKLFYILKNKKNKENIFGFLLLLFSLNTKNTKNNKFKE